MSLLKTLANLFNSPGRLVPTPAPEVPTPVAEDPLQHISSSDLFAELDTYVDGPVGRELLETALDFKVALWADDPDIEDDEGSVARHDARKEANAARFATAERIIRTFGEAIQPRELAVMQDVYYSFTNSLKYRATSTSLIVVRHALSRGWDGIGPWQA